MAGFITYQNKNGKEYATFCIAKWTGSAKINETSYLGQVIDKEKGIYFSKKKGGYFSFSVEKGIQQMPIDYEPKAFSPRKNRRKEIDVLDYGNVFFLDEFLKSTPYYKVFTSIASSNSELLMSLVYFYVLQGGAREYFRDWWEGSYASILFPNAMPHGSKISALYKELSNVELQLKFSRCYLSAILSESGIHGILIDSIGVPNAISMDKREIWNHDGSCNEGARLIYVCERNTGMPLAARSISGNIIDANTIVNTILDLESSEVCTDFVILDAGYYTEENIILLYKKKISFVTRVKKNRKLYKDIFKDHRKGLDDTKNLVIFNGRVLYVKKVECNLCGHKAYAYLALDVMMQGVESVSAISGAVEDKASSLDVERIKESCGTFMIISSEDLDVKEILPVYYTRQQIGQVFDMAKGYGELLQLGHHSQEAFEGHIFVSFLATIIYHLLQKLFKDQKLNMSEALTVLRNHNCKVYNNGDIIPLEAKKKQNYCYNLIHTKPIVYHTDSLPKIW